MLLLLLLAVGCGEDPQEGQNRSRGDNPQAQQQQPPATPVAAPLQDDNVKKTLSSPQAEPVTDEGWIVVSNCNVALVKEQVVVLKKRGRSLSSLENSTENCSVVKKCIMVVYVNITRTKFSESRTWMMANLTTL